MPMHQGGRDLADFHLIWQVSANSRLLREPSLSCQRSTYLLTEPLSCGQSEDSALSFLFVRAVKQGVRTVRAGRVRVHFAHTLSDCSGRTSTRRHVDQGLTSLLPRRTGIHCGQVLRVNYNANKFAKILGRRYRVSR